MICSGKTVNNIGGLPVGTDAGAFRSLVRSQGWFLGAGDEYALNFFAGSVLEKSSMSFGLNWVTKRAYFTVLNAYTGIENTPRNTFTRSQTATPLTASTGLAQSSRNT